MVKDLTRTEIILPRHGDRAKLAKDCMVNARTVYEALRGMRNTETTALIREKALKFYNGQYLR